MDNNGIRMIIIGGGIAGLCAGVYARKHGFATPATVMRYTNNWHGSMESWLITPKTGVKQLPCTVPGLRNFYMVGQWISPGGGLPSGLITARNVIARIGRETKKGRR
jgi:phytoene dehydrogenase-like protein